MNVNKYLSVIIHFLILILLIVFFINNRKNKNNLIFVLCATIIYICYLIEFVRRPNIMNINTQENFHAPIDYTMGPYSNINVDNDMNISRPNTEVAEGPSPTKCGWRKKPCNLPLHPEVAYVGPTGQIGRYIEDPTHNPHMPSVDGKKESRKSMFMFTHNQVSPKCCPSTYTTDNGCVCTTKEQRKFVNRRGYNRDATVNSSF